uniref:Uncharacterized protein n=1 Tax=Plectus sambesii TaxID=2011161 RepID=A0A914WVX8_9BILA
MKGIAGVLSIALLLPFIAQHTNFVFSCFATVPADSQSDTNTETDTDSDSPCSNLPYDKATVMDSDINQFLPYDATKTYPIDFVMSYSIELLGFCEFYTDGSSMMFAASMTTYQERQCKLIDGKPVWVVLNSDPPKVLQCISEGATCTTCTPP